MIDLEDGSTIDPKDEIAYLGSTLSEEGLIGRELGRRIGLAHSDFRGLIRLWRHTSLSKARKLEVFNAVITTKLLYSLASAWPNTSERRRIDGFQNRCLRTVCGIKPAYISRVSNRHVLETTAQTPFSNVLMKQQLLLFGNAAREPEGRILRDSTFVPGSFRPAADRYVRRVGRPRLEWASQLYPHAIAVAGSSDRLAAAVRQPAEWRRNVAAYVGSLIRERHSSVPPQVPLSVPTRRMA